MEAYPKRLPRPPLQPEPNSAGPWRQRFGDILCILMYFTFFTHVSLYIIHVWYFHISSMFLYQTFAESLMQMWETLGILGAFCKSLMASWVCNRMCTFYVQKNVQAPCGITESHQEFQEDWCWNQRRAASTEKKKAAFLQPQPLLVGSSWNKWQAVVIYYPRSWDRPLELWWKFSPSSLELHFPMAMLCIQSCKKSTGLRFGLFLQQKVLSERVWHFSATGLSRILSTHGVPERLLCAEITKNDVLNQQWWFNLLLVVIVKSQAGWKRWDMWPWVKSLVLQWTPK